MMSLPRRLATSLLGHVRSHITSATCGTSSAGKSASVLWSCRTLSLAPGVSSCPSLVASLRTSAAQLGSASYQDVQPDYEVVAETENKITADVVSQVNRSIADRSTGRLFAVVHINGKQFKVTDGDLVVVQGQWPPALGQQLRLEKVLLVGSADFTLLGRPVLDRGMAAVEATVIEKSLSHTKTIFRKKKRKNYRRINFCRMPLTTLRINSVRLEKTVDQS
ncbi:39S ribosomal protein L21, mitochondrial [Amphibalanus amphitrite]|uniref:Large ribosomal subunit protein bL21m n=1 Tax=Amphibalanus amphitrite TaxID=1232801 RepID=A0A6A4WFH4_AMPAM|nr:39S ribosomal protein L21, mitochondrial [Amphibalanus amphitrite]